MCEYRSNVDADPATANPLWAATGELSFHDGATIVAVKIHSGRTTSIWNESGFGLIRDRCPFAGGACSISAAERKSVLDLESKAIVFALGCVGMSPSDE